MRNIVLSLVASLTIAATGLSASDVLATVDGQKITKNDVQTLLRNPNITYDSLPPATQKRVLDQLIDEKLLAKKAKSSGIQKSAEYKTELENIKNKLAVQLWMKSQAKKVKVLDSDVKAFFDKNKAQFNIPKLYEARHILVKTEKEAKDIIAKLKKAKNTKETFVTLAKELSTGPTGKSGGYLGKFPDGKMVPEFTVALNKLKKAEFTKSPVKSQFGYHVIYSEGTTPAKGATLQQSAGKIKQILTQEKYVKMIKGYIESEKKSAKIVIK